LPVSWTTIDVRRANATELLLPGAGNWRIALNAYDAMGNAGAASAAVVVTTMGTTWHAYLPTVRR
jgi:hypothetical protein